MGKVKDSHSIDLIVGSNVNRLRKLLRLSQATLGKSLILHQAAICRIEKGAQSLIPNQLAKLARIFEIPINELFMKPTGLKLLIVNESKEVLEALRRILSTRFEIILACSVKEALIQISSTTRLDLLVTDFEFHRDDQMDGLDVAIATRNKFKACPILTVARPMTVSKRFKTLLALPNSCHLEKPFGKSSFVGAVEDSLKIEEAIIAEGDV